MIVKRLHTNSKIFFSNPYVVRVEFPDMLPDVANAEYRKITRSAYRLLKGTWGYSQLEYENWQVKNDSEPDPPVVVGGATLSNIFSSLFDNNYISRLRGYICFADEMDALQFRLSISVQSIQVTMWPKREFTIHEVVEADES